MKELGVFSKEKLDSLNVSTLFNSDFSPSILRFEYDIVIEEVACGDACLKWSFEKESPQPEADILAMTSPVAVRWHERTLPAILRIRVWEVDA